MRRCPLVNFSDDLQKRLKAELGLPEGRLPPAMYVSTRRRGAARGEGSPSVAVTPPLLTQAASPFQASPPPPHEQPTVVAPALIELRAVTEEQEPERATPEVMHGPPLTEEAEVVVVEEMPAPESTDEEEVLLSTEESEPVVEGEDIAQAADVSGDLVSLFLEDDADEELLVQPRKPERAASSLNRSLASEGPGWVLERHDNEIEERFLRLPAHQPGWFERVAAEKKEVVIFTGNTPSLGDFAVSAVTEQARGTGKREISAYIRCVAGDEEVRLDFEHARAKHGKSIWSAPRLYAQALAPVMAERSKSEAVSLVQVPREHETKAFQDLMKQEQQDRVRQYRFGVLRQKYGQVTEEEMLCNPTSDEFEEFLALLGERVHLRSHKGFKGKDASAVVVLFSRRHLFSRWPERTAQ